jgi:hypothetical protein
MDGSARVEVGIMRKIDGMRDRVYVLGRRRGSGTALGFYGSGSGGRDEDTSRDRADDVSPVSSSSRFARSFGRGRKKSRGRASRVASCVPTENRTRLWFEFVVLVIKLLYNAIDWIRLGRQDIHGFVWCRPIEVVGILAKTRKRSAF